MVSTFATVSVFAKLPSVSLSLPPARSIDVLVAAAPRVIVDAPAPPITVSTFDIVAVFVPFLGELVVARRKIDARVDHGAGDDHGVCRAAANQSIDRCGRILISFALIRQIYDSHFRPRFRASRSPANCRSATRTRPQYTLGVLSL